MGNMSVTVFVVVRISLFT